MKCVLMLNRFPFRILLFLWSVQTFVTFPIVYLTFVSSLRHFHQFIFITLHRSPCATVSCTSNRYFCVCGVYRRFQLWRWFWGLWRRVIHIIITTWEVRFSICLLLLLICFLDKRTDDFLLVNTPLPVLGLLGLYYYFVTDFGPRFMKDRPAFNLKKIIIVYNVGQILLNAHIFFQVRQVFF